MIETRQSALIQAGIADVWVHARDIARWASIMPGYRECEIIDEDSSLWTLKVGVGGMVRTVKVRVHVDAWNGPGEVRFSYRLEGDPVQGSGTYLAEAKGPEQTEITLHVAVQGSGPMAPMWEAMGKPLLPQFARSFANDLKAEIENALGVAQVSSSGPSATAKRGPLAALVNWLRRFWHRLLS